MLSRRLRFEILRRDAHTCRYCGGQAPDVKLTVDHVVPVALGGTDAPENLATACQPCNAGKSSVAPDSPIVANVSDDALRWARAMETATAARQQQLAQRQAYVDQFDAVWSNWTWGEDRNLVDRAPDWQGSVARFYDLGLEIEFLTAAVNETMRKTNIRGAVGEWRYLCGMCWRELEARQDMAREILDAQ